MQAKALSHFFLYNLFPTGFLVLLFTLAGCGAENTPSNMQDTSNTAPQENPYEGMRNLALGFQAKDLGITQLDSNEVFGMIMEWNLGGAAVTLTAFKSGESSLYFSNGGGIIGAGEHEIVQRAAQNFVEAGKVYQPLAKATKLTPMPESGWVNFYFLTEGEKLVGRVAEAAMEEGSSPWSDLYGIGHDLINAIRMVSAENR